MMHVLVLVAALFAALAGMFAAGDPNVSAVVIVAFFFMLFSFWLLLKQLADVGHGVMRTNILRGR